MIFGRKIYQLIGNGIADSMWVYWMRKNNNKGVEIDMH